MEKIEDDVSISNFVKTINDARSIYNTNEELMKEQDLLTQDLLHKLELENLNAPEMMKVASKLKECRKVRRYHKDILEEVSPIVSFIEDPSNRAAMKKIERLLGDVRKQKNKHKNRFYRPRVLHNEVI